jgi:Domain of unknown function (DUF3291)
MSSIDSNATELTAAAGEFELAQVNIARLRAPLDSPVLADFVAALDPVNEVADGSDGFVWRLQSDSGDATDVPVFDDSWLIINLTVWRDKASLESFMYAGLHRVMLRRRREWFEHPFEAMTALWWVPAGHRPTVAEAEQRLVHLRTHGPAPYAFTLRASFPPPAAPSASAPIPSAPAPSAAEAPVPAALADLRQGD